MSFITYRRVAMYKVRADGHGGWIVLDENGTAVANAHVKSVSFPERAVNTKDGGYEIGGPGTAVIEVAGKTHNNIPLC
jgi:hypothetical protein